MLLAKQVRSTGGTSVLVVEKGTLLEEIIQISRFGLVFTTVSSVQEALKGL